MIAGTLSIVHFGYVICIAHNSLYAFSALKIHCSETITSLLLKLGGYHLVERGYITAKVKYRPFPTDVNR